MITARRGEALGGGRTCSTSHNFTIGTIKREPLAACVGRADWAVEMCFWRVDGESLDRLPTGSRPINEGVPKW